MGNKELIRCDVTGNVLHSCEMRVCPHPAIARRYAHGEQANVSIWACKKCRYHKNIDLVGSVCTYREQTND